MGCRILVSVLSLLAAESAVAQAPAGRIAIHLSLTGPGGIVGAPVLDAVRLALEEANVAGGMPAIEIEIYDDGSDDERSREVARKVVASGAVVVVGPGRSTQALAAGPIYGEAGLAAIVPYAHGAGGPNSPTTFRPVFSNSEMGEALATYLHYGLRENRAAVMFADTGYGRPIADGFKTAAARLGVDTQYHAFKSPAEAEGFARLVAAAPQGPAIVLGMVDPDALPVLKVLRREGAHSTIIGTSAIASDAFADGFAKEPEYQRDPGFFTDGVYAVSPMIADSANAETLAFAARYAERYGHAPRWEVAQGYDTMRLAIAAFRAAARGGSPAEVAAQRAAVMAYLASLDSPANAVASLTGPLWFTPDRGRRQAVRVGRFHAGLFESAPLQIVPVSDPDPAEAAAGGLLDIGDGRFARLQRVVYAGVFVNEISRIDLMQSSFGADFYLWLRFAGDAGTESADPTDITFPNMTGDSFDRANAAEQRKLADGTEYRLWRVEGNFRNDFDLHRFPFDQQTLLLSFFNARAAADRIVYVVDTRTPAALRAEPNGVRPNVLDSAFRNLTQWNPLGASERRENLVTDSALGDPARVGVGSNRELSGFLLAVDIQRSAFAILGKTLVPLFLMTLIMFASLFFSVALIKEKITVAITGALSGAVLLTAINSQLGPIGYTIALEYAFYVYFGLSLLCIVSVLAADRFRTAGRVHAATLTDRWARIVFVLAVAATAAGAFAFSVYGTGQIK